MGPPAEVMIRLKCRQRADERTELRARFSGLVFRGSFFGANFLGLVFGGSFSGLVIRGLFFGACFSELVLGLVIRGFTVIFLA